MIPERGFPQIEFEQRLEKAQWLMSEKDLDVMFFCTEAEVRYFTGFLTQFWQSPTRPWFLCLPRKGNPVAVIPEIGADCMERTWIEDIRTWSSASRDSRGAVWRFQKDWFAHGARIHSPDALSGFQDAPGTFARL